MTLIPEFHCILALDSALELANRLFAQSDERDLNQVVTYDTTFNLCGFYVSTLVMKNTQVLNDKKIEPLFPVAYFLHNRKTTETHKFFFKWIFDRLKFSSSVPIVTDREQSIVNSITSYAIGKENLFFCTNHILRDVELWLQKHQMESELPTYKSHMYLLNQSKSVQQFDSQVNGLKPNWKPEFEEYFVKNIQPAFLNNFNKLEGRSFQHFLTKNITSNLSESLHSSMKNFINNKRGKLRADELAVALFIYQNDILHDFNRAFDKFGGEYLIKPEFGHLPKLQIEHGLLKCEDVLREVHENINTNHKEELPEAHENIAEQTLAYFFKRENKISYKSKYNAWLVGHPFYRVARVETVVVREDG